MRRVAGGRHLLFLSTVQLYCIALPPGELLFCLLPHLSALKRGRYQRIICNDTARNLQSHKPSPTVQQGHTAWWLAAQVTAGIKHCTVGQSDPHFRLTDDSASTSSPSAAAGVTSSSLRGALKPRSTKRMQLRKKASTRKPCVNTRYCTRGREGERGRGMRGGETGEGGGVGCAGKRGWQHTLLH